MPQGNAATLPPGLWYKEPTTSSIPRLMLRTAGSYAKLGLMVFCVLSYRSMAYKYTYTSFLGKTMSLGSLSIDEHEPLSTEEIDRMKAEEATKKGIRS